MIDLLADPFCGDALAACAQKNEHPHWQYRIGKALAEIGDLRGVPLLAKRLRQDEQKVYSDETDYEQLLKRNNDERRVAARMLSDLAVMNPDQKEKIRAD